MRRCIAWQVQVLCHDIAMVDINNLVVNLMNECVKVNINFIHLILINTIV